MIAEKPLALIAVADGKSGDLFWIRMDGSEDSCNPDSFMHAFPQLSCVAIDDDSGFVAGFQSLVNAAAANIGSADVCLDDSWDINDAQQIVGRERNQPACHRQLVRSVVDCRRVNSDVRLLVLT